MHAPVLHFTGGVGKIRGSSDNAIKQATLRPEIRDGSHCQRHQGMMFLFTMK
jgi:hypothetical protein